MRLSELRRTNLNLLVVLQSLARTRSVSATAKELNMSQPAVSRALAQLREVFQDQLLVKSGSSMLPTPRCEELGEQLGKVLEGVSAVLYDPVFSAAETDRVFRVATTDYGATSVLPDLIARMTVDAPHAGVEILPFSERSYRQLSSGDIDIVLATDGIDVPPNLHARDLFRETYVCVVSKNHALAALPGDAPIPLNDFIAWPHALVVVFGGRLGLVDRELAKRKLHRRIVLWLPYFSTAPLVAARSDVILTVPARSARPFLDHSALILLSPPVELQPFSYRAIWHERTHRDAGARWFRQILAESCR